MESDLIERITRYLSTGGLFNPECADHDAVRDLIMDCRTALSARSRDAERYRWLRDKSPGQYDQPIVVTQARSGDHMKYVGPLAYGDLDAAIDAALASKPSEAAE